MLSKKIEDALNHQIKVEGEASANYLAMGSWCAQKNMDSCAQFFFNQSDEERFHMLKLFHYIIDMDGNAKSPSVDLPREDYNSIQDVFNLFLAMEQKVTRCIDDLIKIATEEEDNATHQFLQWYVNEQREEEAVAKSILAKIELIGDGPQTLYFIDKEIENINNAEASSK